LNLELVPFDKSIHDRSKFDCGNQEINTYLKTQLSSDLKRYACFCFILKEVSSNDVIGFITLSAAQVDKDNIPNEHSKKLAPYNAVPSMLIGRMGVDKKHSGNGYGSLLVFKANKVAYEAPVGFSLLLVEAKDEKLVKYYEDLGFILLKTTGKYPYLIKKVVP
jgi:GNAT superfamily N-acetyltransferase